METDIEKIATNLYQLDFDSVDWGQFYRIVPHNKYGDVDGDSFCTNDYIHDEKILKFLDKYHEERFKWLLGIDDVNYDSFQIAINNNMLFLPRREDEDDVTEIYSLNGALIGRYISAKMIDLGHLCKGIYIVKIKTRKRTITKKIYKS